MSTPLKPIGHTSRYHTSQTYLLPSDELEAQRLSEQHIAVKELFENRIVLAPIELTAHSEVLDIGTGSGAWALDFVRNHPDADKASTTGVDIGSRLFPADHPPNMSFRTASVLALPAEWENKFSLVHQRLLISALKYDEWAIAIKEIFRVTEPGGHAQLCEVNTTKTSSGPNSSKALDLINRLKERVGMDLLCTDRIPALMKEAGFVDVEVHWRVVKFAHWGGDMGVRCAKNLIAVWRGMKMPIMRLGGIGMVENEEEYDNLMDDAEHEWEDKPGAEMGWFIFTGKKPERVSPVQTERL